MVVEGDYIYLFNLNGVRVYSKYILDMVSSVDKLCQNPAMNIFNGDVYLGCEENEVYRLEVESSTVQLVPVDGIKLDIKDNHVYHGTAFHPDGSEITIRKSKETRF